MPKTGENIYKRKDGRWEGRYIKSRKDGKTKYGSVYAHSYREVKKKLETAKKQPPITKGDRIADVGEQWLLDSAVSLKKTSVNKYEDILRCYILPEFGEKRLPEVTNQWLIEFANSLLVNVGAKNQGLSPATVAEIKGI